MIHDNSITNIQVKYDSQELGISPNKVLEVDYINTPTVLLNKYQLIRSDGEIVTNSNFGEKKIKIKGRINASSKTTLENEINRLKAFLVGYGKNLDLLINGETIRYIATVSETSYSIYNECSCLYEITFISNAFGKNTTATSLTFGTFTDGDESYTNSVSGSYKTNPKIIMNIALNIPYWTNKYINIANSALNQNLRITNTFKHNDTITVDCENKVITKTSDTTSLWDNCDSITGWTSTNTLSLETTNQIEGTGALKVVMASSSASTSVSKLNTASKDLSATGLYFIVPIFIPTPTSGSVLNVNLLLGSDSTLGTNYNSYSKTTQVDGSAITTNAWNYFKFVVSDSPTSSSGTLNKSAVKSYSILINSTSTMQLNGVLIDYITYSTTTRISEYLDYEGIFPNLNLGNSTLTFTDEFIRRNIIITGEYYKRFL